MNGPDEGPVPGDYVRRYYGVPAEIGGRVLASGKPAEIVGFDGSYLQLRLDEESVVASWHPTWHIAYLDETREVVWEQSCHPDARCWACRHGAKP